MDARQIPLKAVSSSNVAAVGYDEKTKVMVVEFKGNAKYKITPVTSAEHEAFINAPSLGKHYNSVYKNSGQFDIVRL